MLTLITSPVSILEVKQMAKGDEPFTYGDGQPVMGVRFRPVGEPEPEARLLKVEKGTPGQEEALQLAEKLAGQVVCLRIRSDLGMDARIGRDGDAYAVTKTKFSVTAFLPALEKDMQQAALLLLPDRTPQAKAA